MSASPDLVNARRPLASLYWWALLATGLGVCALIVLSHGRAQRELAQAELLLGRVREARIDFANGFLHVALADDPALPFRRETGLALIDQSLADIESVAELGPASPVDRPTAQEFSQQAAQFRNELAAWNVAGPDERQERAVGLRLTLHRLDLLAERIDARAKAQLDELGRALDRRFLIQIGVAAILVGGIGGMAVRSIRSQRETIEALRESEERVRLVSDGLPDSYVYQYAREADGGRRFIYVSAGVERIHGATPEDVIAGRVVLVAGLDARERAILHAKEEESARQLTDFEMEFWVAGRQGNHRLLHVRSRPRKLADGSVLWSGFATDLTELRKAREALEEQANLLRSMSALARVGAWKFDPQTGEGTWTDEVARIHDMDPAKATSREIGVSVYQGESRTRIEAAIRAAVTEGTPYDLELEMITPAGKRKWVRTQGEAVWNEGRVVQVRGAIQDITAHRQVEIALRESEGRFRQLFEQAGDGIIIYSADRRYEDINTLALAMVGYQRDELIGQPRGVLTPESERARLELFESALIRGATSIQDWPLRRKDGSIVRVEMSVRRLSDDRILCIVRDQTERKRGEARTTLQWLVTRELAAGAGVEPTMRRIVEHCGTKLGWEAGAFWRRELPAQKLKLVAAWHEAEDVAAGWVDQSRTRQFEVGEGVPGLVAATGQALRMTAEELVTADPRYRVGALVGVREAAAVPVSVRGGVAGVFEFFRRSGDGRDAAELELLGGIGAQAGQYLERLELAEQFRQSQKMEALGTMAGGIAHDFNNILTAIVLHAALAEMGAKDDPELEGHLAEVIQAGKRASDLVKQILAFSRRQEQSLRSVRIERLVEECAKLLRATQPSTIEIRTHAAADLPAVQADPIQVHQVLMNLGNNAGHAMRDRPGLLEIGVQAVAIDQTTAGGPKPGRHVRVTVRDTGHGMDAATKARIFEPFFTTKALGEGTGLGLAVVHGIMHQHGGAILVESQPGVGTTFELYFPVAETAEAAEPAPEPLQRGAGERILVIDDEPGIAMATCQMLNEFGYKAEVRHGAEEALAAMVAEPDRFALVLTDYTMPRMTGLELACRVRQIRPALPILVTSGGATDQLRPKVEALGGAELLPKPATPGQMLATLRRLLEDKVARL